MSTRLGGAAIAAYNATGNAAYEPEGGFVAIPVYVVTEGKVEGGNLLPVYEIESADLKENGGRFTLQKGTPITVNVSVTNRKVVRDRAMAVYVVGGSL